MRPLLSVVLVCAVITACGGAKSSVGPTPTPQSSAQRYALSGTVLGFNAVPLANAVMEVTAGPNQGSRVTADGSGRYRFESLTAGTMTIKASAQGYADASTQVALTENLDASFRLDPLPAQFAGVEKQVGVLANRPTGTYGASVVNEGPGCALRVTATGKFLDKNLNTIRTITWAADPNRLFKVGDTSLYEFCCILASEASQIFRVDVDFNWLNRPCS